MNLMKKLCAVLLAVTLFIPTNTFVFADDSDNLILYDSCVDNSVRYEDRNVWYFAPSNQDYGYTKRIRFQGSDSFLTYNIEGYDISKIEIETVASNVRNMDILASEDGLNFAKLTYPEAVDAVPNPTEEDGLNRVPSWHKYVYTVKNVPADTSYIKLAAPAGYVSALLDVASVRVYGTVSDGISRFKETFDNDSEIIENGWFMDKELTEPFNLSASDSKVILSDGETINKSLFPSVSVKNETNKEYWLGVDFSYSGNGSFGAEIGENIFVGVNEKDDGVYPYIRCGEEQKNPYITDSIDFVSGDTSRLYSQNNITVSEGQNGKFTDTYGCAMVADKTKEGYFIYNAANISSVKVTAQRSQWIYECMARIEVSSDGNNWITPEQNAVEVRAASDFREYEITASDLGLNINYVKVIIPPSYKEDGSLLNNYTNTIDKAEFTYSAKSPSEVYGTSALSENTNYKFVAVLTPNKSQVNLGIVDKTGNVEVCTASLNDIKADDYSLLTIKNDGFNKADIDTFSYEVVGTNAFNEYSEEFWNAKENQSYENAQNAITKISSAPECMMKNAYLYILNEMIKSYELERAGFEERLNTLLNTEITKENVFAQYAVYQALLTEKPKFEQIGGAYDSEFARIEEKFSNYLIYLTRFEENFDSAGQTVGNGWFDDEILTSESSMVITDNKNIVIDGAKSISRRLSDIISKDGKGGYWFSADLNYNGESDEFAGISLGDYYYFGMKRKNGGMYPYIGTKSTGTSETYTDVYTFAASDFKKFYSYSNVSASLREGDTKFPDDTTSLMNATNGDGNFIIEVDKPTSMEISVIRHQVVSECYPEIYVSNDLYSWSSAETEKTFVSKDVDYEKWTVFAELPESAKYIKVVTPIARRENGTVIANWASILCGMKINGISDNTSQNELFGTEALDKNTDYTFVASVENAGSLTGLFVFKGDELVDKVIAGFSASENDIDVFTLKSGEHCSLTADNVIIEYVNPELFEKYCSLFENAVKTKNSDEIEKAILQAESASACLMKSAHISALNKIKSDNEKMLPVINYISFEGNFKAGSVVKAIVNYVDEGENLKEFSYKWYVDGVLRAVTQSFSIPSNAAGKSIKLEVVPITKNSQYGESKIYTDTIKATSASDLTGGGSGGSSGGGSRGGSGGSPILAAPVLGSGSENTVAFVDVKGHWAEKEILKLAQTGIIKGMNENEFEPESNISRSAVAAMISRIISDGKSYTAADKYSDVSKSDWYYSDVSNVTANGVMGGDGENFYPENMITREEMAKVLYELCRICGVSARGGEYQKFADDEFISEWAKDAVYSLRQNELISGFDNSFRPKDNLTRAEAAILLYRLQAMRGKIS